MAFCDLLRMTVLLAAGAATVLAAVTVIAVSGGNDTLTVFVAAGWWTIALFGGLILGRPARAAEAMRSVLAEARTATAMPEIGTPGRAALARLWPIGAFALIAGVLGFIFPGVSAIGAGFALGPLCCGVPGKERSPRSRSAMGFASTSNPARPCSRSG
jgi:hypothetical protein